MPLEASAEYVTESNVSPRRLAVVPNARIALAQLLGDKVIGYHAALAKALKSVNAGILLSQLLYWQPKASRADGFFWKTREEIYDETALSRREQETARKILREAGITEEQRLGVPARVHFRVDMDALISLLGAGSDQVGNVPTVRAESAHPVGRKAPIQLVQNEPTITENTSESTSENTQSPLNPPTGGGSPPIEEVAEPGVTPAASRGNPVPLPPTPSSAALLRAEARMLDMGRVGDRKSSIVRDDGSNGWSGQPPERLERIRQRVWDAWREKNPSRIGRKDLARIPFSVAPDEVKRFQAQTLAYLKATDNEYVMGLKRWLDEWRDWVPKVATSPAPRSMAEAMMLNEERRRKEA